MLHPSDNSNTCHVMFSRVSVLRPSCALDLLSYTGVLLIHILVMQRQVMGRTLLDPKKDSKWERGRTRQALHFGAHVRGGKAVGAEVKLDSLKDIPVI